MNASTPRRLTYLDALRGVAAVTVLLQHSAEIIWPAYFDWSHEVFRPGAWGVAVFFMISGFVIPMSIRRENDVISFWIGRLFRLFPLYWAVIIAAYFFFKLGSYPVSSDFASQEPQNLIANFTMVQEFLATPQLVGAAWSLAYEFVFYLFISIAILTGFKGTKHAAVKTTLLVLFGSLSVGLLIHPTYVLSPQSIVKSAVVPSALVAAGLVLLWPKLRSTSQKVIGAALLFATIGLTLNQPRDLWFSLLLFATIGVGWAYHGAYRGAYPVSVPIALSVFAFAISFMQFQWWSNPLTRSADLWTLAAAHAVFGGAYFLQRVEFPKPLQWLGNISYSVYLIHAIAIHVVPPIDAQPVLTLAIWVGVTLTISTATYYLIEVPFQRVGKDLRNKWRQSRFPQVLDLRDTSQSSREPNVLID